MSRTVGVGWERLSSLVRYDVHEGDERITLRLAGEVDVSSPQLVELIEWLGARCPRVVLDLRRVHFLDAGAWRCSSSPIGGCVTTEESSSCVVRTVRCVASWRCPGARCGSPSRSGPPGAIVTRSPIFLGTPSLEAVREAGITSMASIVVPGAGGKPVGMVSVHSDRVGDWSREQRRQLRELARATGWLLADQTS